MDDGYGDTDLHIGVGRPTLDPNVADCADTADFWGIYSSNGTLYHAGRGDQYWSPQQGPYGAGDVIRLLLDSDAGTLTVKKHGTMLGVAVTSGLTENLS